MECVGCPGLPIRLTPLGPSATPPSHAPTLQLARNQFARRSTKYQITLLPTYDLIQSTFASNPSTA